MAHLGIEQMQIITQCFTSDITILGSEVLPRSTMATVELIHIVNKLNHLFLRQILIQPAPKFSGEIILAIRKSTCTTKAAHDTAGLAVDAMIHFFCGQGTKTLINSIASLKHHQLQLGIFHYKFIGCKNRCRSTTNNGYIVHNHPPNSLAALLVFAKFRNGAFHLPRAHPF